MLSERGLRLRLTDRARAFLAEAGYDPTYGARPLKRAIQQHVQDPLALALLEGQFKPGETVVADLDPQTHQLVFNAEVTAEAVPA
jgi:ATP-dependent Clp protease ATP-binding subunit ClpB